jgi:hypothetical protein
MTFRKALVTTIGLFLATTIGAVAAGAQDAQSSQPSVADAARKAREQQKSQPKAAKVFTDDDVRNLKGGISVVGNEPAPPPATGANAAAPAGAAAPAKGEAKDESYWRKKFAEARRALADDSRELNVLRREFGLKQQQYYSNPDVALREQYSRKDLDDTQAAIDAKKADVDKDNQALSDLQDELRTSGGEPGWASETAPPASQSPSEPAAQPAAQPAAPAPGGQPATPPPAQSGTSQQQQSQ